MIINQLKVAILLSCALLCACNIANTEYGQVRGFSSATNKVKKHSLFYIVFFLICKLC